MSAQTIAPPPVIPLEAEDTGEVLRLWTREEFYQAEDLGWFNNEKVELIHGKVYTKRPMKPLHTMGIRACAEMLAALFGAGFDVRQQMPVVLATDGEPLPDILVVPGSWRDYAQHPTQADVLLLVEVSDTTLSLDRNEKAALYAEAGIPDYWLLNMQNRALEVRREPAIMPDAPYGFGYRALTVYSEQDTVTSLALPHVEIRVSDLLPPAVSASTPTMA